MGYSFRLTARVLLYAPSHRQDNTYHSLCYTSRGALAGTTRNSSMGPPHEGSIRRPIAPWANALPTELHLAPLLQNSRDIYVIFQYLRYIFQFDRRDDAGRVCLRASKASWRSETCSAGRRDTGPLGRTPATSSTTGTSTSQTTVNFIVIGVRIFQKYVSS